MNSQEKARRAGKKRSLRLGEVRTSRIDAILEADEPALLSLEECFLYCRKRLGLGRVAFQRAVRPRLKVFPFYVHEGRLQHFRVSFQALRQVVNDMIAEAEKSPYDAGYIHLMRDLAHE